MTPAATTTTGTTATTPTSTTATAATGSGDPDAAARVAEVTVVVPVYDGADEVRACLESVLAHAAGLTTPFSVIIVDDASPDPAVPAYLDQLVASPTPVPVTLLRNATNLGFVASVNRAMAEVPGDAVLLNADTVVTAGWLDRLAEAAQGEDVATVTPLSNEGSITTVPPPLADAFDLGTDQPRIDECAAFVADQGLGLWPEVITGVGFCMWVSATAWARCGPFDQEAYGRGYGEEVDFCLRAGRLGLRHLVEDRTYVHHHGEVSFAEGAGEGRREARRVLHRRFRWFPVVNRHERRHDPLALSFAALELGLDARDPSRPHVLHLLHGPPDDVGGTEKHLAALVEALGPEFDMAVFFPVESGFGLWTRWVVDGRVAEHRYVLPGSVRRVTALDDEVAAEALRTTFDLFDVDVVHIQNLKGLSLAPLAVLEEFEGRVVSSVHDPYLACPHYSLLYRDAEPCGVPEDLAVCARCLPETESLDVAHLERMRSVVAGSLDRIDQWVFASQSSADHLARAYPLDPARVQVIEHGTTIAAPRRHRLDPSLVADEPLRVAFVGRGVAKKGLDLVNHLAEAVAGEPNPRGGGPVEVHHFGELAGRASAHVRLHGTYDNELLGDLLDVHGIQVVLLPGAVPESFGLVLTEAVLAGRPAIGASYGALGERIRRLAVGWTIDPGDPDELVELVRRLDANRWEVARVATQVAATPVETVRDTAGRYGALYRGATDQLDDPEGSR